MLRRLAVPVVIALWLGGGSHAFAQEPPHDVTAQAKQTQPFVNNNFGQGWALGLARVITANWDASDGNGWTVPLGIGITPTTVFNRRPINLGVNYYNLERPDGGGAQLLRFVVSLLYPR